MGGIGVSMIQNHWMHVWHFQRNQQNAAFKINYSTKQNKKCLGNLGKHEQCS